MKYKKESVSYTVNFKFSYSWQDNATTKIKLLFKNLKKKEWLEIIDK